VYLVDMKQLQAGALKHFVDKENNKKVSYAFQNLPQKRAAVDEIQGQDVRAKEGIRNSN
jgi:hypothetical protein